MPPTPRPGVTCRSVVHSPWGSTRTAERQAVLVDRAGRGRRDPRLAHVGVASVAEHQAVVVDPRVVLALLLQVVLDLEEVGEVRGRLDPYLHVHGALVVVEDRQLLVEASAHGALADDRCLRVDVDGPGARHQEEPGLEVLQVVDGQGVEALPVDGEHPARQEPGVEGEQPGRIGQRGFDVAAVVTHDERVAVEDLDVGSQTASSRTRPAPVRGPRSNRGRGAAAP